MRPLILGTVVPSPGMDIDSTQVITISGTSRCRGRRQRPLLTGGIWCWRWRASCHCKWRTLLEAIKMVSAGEIRRHRDASKAHSERCNFAPK